MNMWRLPHSSRRPVAAVLIGMLVLALAMGTAGCSGAEPPASEDQEGETAPEQEEENEPKQIGEEDGSEQADGSDDWVADGAIAEGEYSQSIDLGSYLLFWDSEQDRIRIGIEARTTGWVAVGIQPGQRMKDADIVLGYVSGGEVTVLDEYSTGDYGPHKPDLELGGTDDIIAFAGSESGDTTVIEFERLMDTGDAYDIALEAGVQTTVIWAYGSNDSESMRHATRGYADIVP